MKLRKWLLGALVVLGTILASTGQASAALVIEPANPIDQMTMNSYNMPVPIYNDPECTQNSGRTLSTAVSTWQVFRWARTDPNPNNTAVSYDLGGGQWVKKNDVFTGIGANDTSIKEAYSAGKKVPVYDSPQLWHIIGYLDPAISEWAVTRAASLGHTSNNLERLDLGNDQWVDATKDVQAIRTAFIFTTGDPLYNGNGVQTGTINQATYYKVFGVKTINGQTYVNLGTDDQWANFKDGTTN
ncbi:MAG: hypothetical protein LKF36_00680 [Lactobacillus sp.]|nr:hypothetical protein [Lactobacillus sp.]